jgi:microcystin-dependent protein
MANFSNFIDGESPAQDAINSRLQQLENAILLRLSTPGAVAPFSGAATPTGWLLCDGSAVSRSTYAALFSAIGTTYGAGNGTTTFNLPDLRGRTVIGSGQGAGMTNRLLAAQLGEETHQLTTAELPAHTHNLIQHTGSNVVQSGTTRDRNAAAANLGTTGSGTPHNNMQPSLVTNFIIKT